MKPTFPLSVFYDGACLVCGSEIDHYRRLNHGERLQFIDISAADFDAAQHGRSLTEFQTRLQVKDARGRFFSGIDAFPAIWAALPNPGYRRLGKLINVPGIHLLARCGYTLFARTRRFLPKRNHCSWHGSPPE